MDESGIEAPRSHRDVRIWMVLRLCILNLALLQKSIVVVIRWGVCLIPRISLLFRDIPKQLLFRLTLAGSEAARQAPKFKIQLVPC
jgi:hypothetical protein